ncbi:MerR family transcriptional regulator [Chloroflexia bacterium SDU3-3]|nr:MerR family transcriptional regulator [Chloroflexia bacterium SDU3-3]
MIKIGDFARLGQVSIVTLRHYDEIGLLKPVEVDSFTGYRYYSVSQLPRLTRILALKDLGFSLDQIEAVLGGLTLDHLRGMLQLRHAEVEQQIAQEQGRLLRIAARIRQIESEDAMPSYDVVLKTLPAQLIASRRVTIPTNDQVPQYLDAAYMETYTHLRERGARDTGPCFAIWHQPAEVLTNEDAEAAVPIDRSIASGERVQVYELPPQQVAAAVHYGGFDGLGQAHMALLAWIEANGYRSTGTYREVYIHHGDGDMHETATEVQYPIERP